MARKKEIWPITSTINGKQITTGIWEYEDGKATLVSNTLLISQAELDSKKKMMSKKIGETVSGFAR